MCCTSSNTYKSNSFQKHDLPRHRRGCVDDGDDKIMTELWPPRNKQATQNTRQVLVTTQ